MGTVSILLGMVNLTLLRGIAAESDILLSTEGAILCVDLVNSINKFADDTIHFIGKRLDSKSSSVTYVLDETELIKNVATVLRPYCDLNLYLDATLGTQNKPFGVNTAQLFMTHAQNLKNAMTNGFSYLQNVFGSNPNVRNNTRLRWFGQIYDDAWKNFEKELSFVTFEGSQEYVLPTFNIPDNCPSVTEIDIEGLYNKVVSRTNALRAKTGFERVAYVALGMDLKIILDIIGCRARSHIRDAASTQPIPVEVLANEYRLLDELRKLISGFGALPTFGSYEEADYLKVLSDIRVVIESFMAGLPVKAGATSCLIPDLNGTAALAGLQDHVNKFKPQYSLTDVSNMLYTMAVTEVATTETLLNTLNMESLEALYAALENAVPGSDLETQLVGYIEGIVTNDPNNPLLQTVNPELGSLFAHGITKDNIQSRFDTYIPIAMAGTTDIIAPQLSNPMPADWFNTDGTLSIVGAVEYNEFLNQFDELTGKDNSTYTSSDYLTDLYSGNFDRVKDMTGLPLNNNLAIAAPLPTNQVALNMFNETGTGVIDTRIVSINGLTMKLADNSIIQTWNPTLPMYLFTHAGLLDDPVDLAEVLIAEVIAVELETIETFLTQYTDMRPYQVEKLIQSMAPTYAAQVYSTHSSYYEQNPLKYLGPTTLTDMDGAFLAACDGAIPCPTAQNFIDHYKQNNGGEDGLNMVGDLSFAQKTTFDLMLLEVELYANKWSLFNATSFFSNADKQTLVKDTTLFPIMGGIMTFVYSNQPGSRPYVLNLWNSVEYTDATGSKEYSEICTEFINKYLSDEWEELNQYNNVPAPSCTIPNWDTSIHQTGAAVNQAGMEHIDDAFYNYEQATQSYASLTLEEIAKQSIAAGDDTTWQWLLAQSNNAGTYKNPLAYNMGDTTIDQLYELTACENLKAAQDSTTVYFLSIEDSMLFTAPTHFDTASRKLTFAGRELWNSIVEECEALIVENIMESWTGNELQIALTTDDYSTLVQLTSAYDASLDLNDIQNTNYLDTTLTSSFTGVLATYQPGWFSVLLSWPDSYPKYEFTCGTMCSYWDANAAQYHYENVKRLIDDSTSLSAYMENLHKSDNPTFVQFYLDTFAPKDITTWSYDEHFYNSWTTKEIEDREYGLHKMRGEILISSDVKSMLKTANDGVTPSDPLSPEVLLAYDKIVYANKTDFYDRRHAARFDGLDENGTYLDQTIIQFGEPTSAPCSTCNHEIFYDHTHLIENAYYISAENSYNAWHKNTNSTTEYDETESWATVLANFNTWANDQTGASDNYFVLADFLQGTKDIVVEKCAVNTENVSVADYSRFLKYIRDIIGAWDWNITDYFYHQIDLETSMFKFAEFLTRADKSKSAPMVIIPSDGVLADDSICNFSNEVIHSLP